MASFEDDDDNDDDETVPLDTPLTEEEDGKLLFDLQELGVFDFCTRHEQSSVHESARVLETLQTSLQSGEGMDDEWKTAISHRDFALVSCLFQFLWRPELSTEVFANAGAAARCLAFAGNVWPKMWLEFTAQSLKNLQLVCRAARFAVDQIRQVLAKVAERSSLPIICTTYLGFDERDVRQYNLSGYGDDSPTSSPGGRRAGGRRTSTHGITGLEDVDDLRAAILVWLLVLFQFFSDKNPLISAKLRASLPDSRASVATSAGSEEVSETLTTTCASLLAAASQLSEDSYLQSIKVVAAIHRQFPPSSPSGSGIVVRLCAESAISEGLLHILNDVGYPSHLSPETLAILHLCIDLANYEGQGQGGAGFFYSNDVNIIVDIAVRELLNLATEACFGEAEEAEAARAESGREEEVRVMYVRLVAAVLKRGGEERYRQDELKALLTRLSESRDPHRAWSKDEAAQVLSTSGS